MNLKEIGVVWVIWNDSRFVILIKYRIGGNVVGYFCKNVKLLIVVFLFNWLYVFFRFFRCLIRIIIILLIIIFIFIKFDIGGKI